MPVRIQNPWAAATIPSDCRARPSGVREALRPQRFAMLKDGAEKFQASWDPALTAVHDCFMSPLSGCWNEKPESPL